jgi:hypothetical protein
MNTFLIRVESSAIRNIGYDGSVLTVEFHTGRTSDNNEGSSPELV